MDYEICKGIKDKDGDMVWSAIAWSDVRTHANDILYALSATYINDRFAILHNGQVVKEN